MIFLSYDPLTNLINFVNSFIGKVASDWSEAEN